ncbi:MAG: PilN domain-containing protein [Phycisphaeraceae bacterium]|nr:PilN domain-containing protein [Phycisphaerales bacterium]QOJ18294.1 MAG: PilN domain-containing protein [Phycisphaeraceae bacterium]
MRQHEIDLLPEVMRIKTQARASASRNVTMATLTVTALVLLSTHAKMVRGAAESELRLLRHEVKVLEQNEREADRLQSELERLRRLEDRQRRVETPLPISRIIAELVGAMPDSMTIDRLDVNAEQVRRQRSTPSKGGTDPGPRVLVAEVAGFARDDLDITRFVSNLDGREPFADVSLDYSRQRQVHGVPAREFRLSFTIDFDAAWALREVDPSWSQRKVTHVD